MKKMFKPMLMIGLAIGVSAMLSCTSSVKTKPSISALDIRVDSVLALMTIDEKIGQLNMYNGNWAFTGPVPDDDHSQQRAEMIKSGRVGAMLNVLTVQGTRTAQEMAVENSRLGIPLLFGYDVIHGYRTIFPIPLAQAASWDLSLAQEASRIAALEAASSGQHWTFAPMIDVSRDGRWGRIMEGAGEDPHLTAEMGKAWIRGYQGDDLSSELTIAACAKHFAGYGFAEGGRDYNTAELSLTTLHNVVLPPFRAAAAAGVATFMNSFNDINGVPATADRYLQRDLLKGAWEYPGMVVSDWGSIGEMIAHGYAADSVAAARLALAAGSDMDMEANVYVNHLNGLLEQGELSVEYLNDAVRRVLKLKFKLGLFDDPYKYCSQDREKNNLLSADNLGLARDVARKSMVLLKNENNLLPLSKDVGTIAIIGQLAASKDIHLGNWRAQGKNNSGVSLLEGVKEAVSEKTKVVFADGYALTAGERGFAPELTFVDDSGEGFEAAIDLAQNADVVILALGEDCYQSGEGRSQVDTRLKGLQVDLLMEILKVNQRVVVTLSNGRPLAIPEVAEHAPAILETWLLGSEAGNAIADVLFGEYNPSGKLPVSFPYHVGQEPLYYNNKSTGRPLLENGLVFWSHYTDSPNRPLYPFGYGLSYTSFQYSDFKVTNLGDKLKVSVRVANTGSIVGEEVVQLYIRDVSASVIRPTRELKKFCKTEIAPGKTKEISFELIKDDLSFYDQNGLVVFEPGYFDISIGCQLDKLKTKRVMF